MPRAAAVAAEGVASAVSEDSAARVALVIIGMWHSLSIFVKRKTCFLSGKCFLDPFTFIIFCLWPGQEQHYFFVRSESLLLVIGAGIF